MGGRQFGDFLSQRYLLKAERLLLECNRQMAELGARESPFCKEGCTHCCCQTFFVSAAEVDVIAARLLRDAPLLARFRARSAQREELLREQAALFAACAERGEAGSRAATEFLHRRIPCALLEDDRCLVYEVRPLVCASFVSIVPARVCASEPKASLSTAMRRLLTETRRALKKLEKGIGRHAGERLDISRQVAERLAEAGNIAPDR